MGIVVGFIPWIVYWILVGNVPFTTAVTIAFAITLLIQIALRIRGQPLRTLDIGNLVVFAVLLLAAYLVPDDVLERWLQPLSSLGLFLIALIGILVGRPVRPGVRRPHPSTTRPREPRASRRSPPR